MESRLALRTAEERSRALHGRADQLVRAAQEERDTRVREIERRNRLSFSLRQTLRDEISEGNSAQLPLFDFTSGGA
jgi:hypothetical protein